MRYRDSRVGRFQLLVRENITEISSDRLRHSYRTLIEQVNLEDNFGLIQRTHTQCEHSIYPDATGDVTFSQIPKETHVCHDLS